MTSTMRDDATELMVRYARDHRDRRNLTTHLVGVPLIVFAAGLLLARPAVPVAELDLTPAWLAWGLATLWYVTRGNLVLGLAASGLNALLLTLAHTVAALASGAWLVWGVACLALGWAVQTIGHCYEGRRPAAALDLRGLLIGPMFVAAELLFSLGWGRRLLAEIERRAGPLVLRDLHHPATR